MGIHEGFANLEISKTDSRRFAILSVFTQIVKGHEYDLSSFGSRVHTIRSRMCDLHNFIQYIRNWLANLLTRNYLVDCNNRDIVQTYPFLFCRLRSMLPNGQPIIPIPTSCKGALANAVISGPAMFHCRMNSAPATVQMAVQDFNLPIWKLSCKLDLLAVNTHHIWIMHHCSTPKFGHVTRCGLLIYSTRQLVLQDGLVWNLYVVYCWGSCHYFFPISSLLLFQFIK